MREGKNGILREKELKRSAFCIKIPKTQKKVLKNLEE